MPRDRITAILENAADSHTEVPADLLTEFEITRVEASSPNLWREVITVPLAIALADLALSSLFSFPPSLDTLILGPWWILAAAVFFLLLAVAGWLTAAYVKISVRDDQLKYGWRTYSLRELSLPHLEGHGHLVVSRDHSEPLIILGRGHSVCPAAAKRSGEVAEHLNAAIMYSEIQAALQATASAHGSPYRAATSNAEDKP